MEPGCAAICRLPPHGRDRDSLEVGKVSEIEILIMFMLLWNEKRSPESQAECHRNALIW